MNVDQEGSSKTDEPTNQGKHDWFFNTAIIKFTAIITIVKNLLNSIVSIKNTDVERCVLLTQMCNLMKNYK